MNRTGMTFGRQVVDAPCAVCGQTVRAGEDAFEVMRRGSTARGATVCATCREAGFNTAAAVEHRRPNQPRRRW